MHELRPRARHLDWAGAGGFPRRSPPRTTPCSPRPDLAVGETLCASAPPGRRGRRRSWSRHRRPRGGDGEPRPARTESPSRATVVAPERFCRPRTVRRGARAMVDPTCATTSGPQSIGGRITVIGVGAGPKAGDQPARPDGGPGSHPRLDAAGTSARAEGQWRADAVRRHVLPLVARVGSTSWSRRPFPMSAAAEAYTERFRPAGSSARSSWSRATDAQPVIYDSPVPLVARESWKSHGTA